MSRFVNEPMESYISSGSSTLFDSMPTEYSDQGLSTVFSQCKNHFPQHISILLQKLESFRKLEENWDSYGAAAPLETAIDKAINFIINHHEFDLPFYFTAPGVNGEVLLEFCKNEKSIEVFFSENDLAEVVFYQDDEVVDQQSLDQISIVEKAIDFFK